MNRHFLNDGICVNILISEQIYKNNAAGEERE